MPDDDGGDGGDDADGTTAVDAIRDHRDTADDLRRVLRSLTQVDRDTRQIETDVLEMIEKELWAMNGVIDHLEEQDDTEDV